MFREYFNFSGIGICIEAPQRLELTEKLSRFASEPGDGFYRVSLEFAKTLTEPEAEPWSEDGMLWHCLRNTAEGGKQRPYAFVGGSGRRWRIVMSEEYRDTTDAVAVLRTLDLNHILLAEDAVVLHASYIEHEGEAILFCAPSGTGKSTQAALWAKYRRAETVNGDRCLLKKCGDGFAAGGMYYSGTSEFCKNRTLPIRAIVLLEQAKYNAVEPISGIAAFRRIFRECAHKTEYAEDSAKAAQLILRLVESVPTLRLSCLPNEGAVNALEQSLRSV